MYRKKEGFGVPIENWINEYKNDFNRVILENLDRNIINYDSRIFQSLLNKKVLSQQESWFFWKSFILCLWSRIHLHGEDFNDIVIIKS